MLIFVVTVEFTDGSQQKVSLPAWWRVKDFLEPYLYAPQFARRVQRVAIIPQEIVP